MPRRVVLRSNTTGGTVNGVPVAGLTNGSAVISWLSSNTWTDSGASTLYCDATHVTAVTWEPIQPILIYGNTFYDSVTVGGNQNVTFQNCEWQALGQQGPPAQTDADTAVERVLARHRAQLHREYTEHTERQTQAHAASGRAMQLLLKVLSPEQRQQFERDRYFEVIAGASKRRYRIREGIAGNVRLVDPSGREVTQYCAHPCGVPVGDVMLAQKLQIEHDEAAFLSVANVTPLLARRA